MKFEGDGCTMSEINVTPFTDVLLVLLVVFMMMAALVAPPGFQRHLPCKCGHHAASAPQPLVVTVDARGNIEVGERASDAQRLYADLRRGLTVAKTHAIALDADAKAPYGAILRVLDAAKAAGDADVALVTQ